MGLSFVSPLFFFCILFIYLLFCISLCTWTHITHRPRTCLTEDNIGDFSSSILLTHALTCLCYTAYCRVASCEFPGGSFSVSSSYLSGITCKPELLPFVPASRGLDSGRHAPAKALDGAFLCPSPLLHVTYATSTTPTLPLRK